MAFIFVMRSTSVKRNANGNGNGNGDINGDGDGDGESNGFGNGHSNEDNFGNGIGNGIGNTMGGSKMHRHDQSLSRSLPAISEDETSYIDPRNTPPVPVRAWNRPKHRPIIGMGYGLSMNDEDGPPAYNQFDPNGVEGPRGEKLTEIRKGIGNNKHIARRGGWKRLALLGLIAAIIIIALGVGLGVGLRKKGNSSAASSSGSTDPGASSSSTSGGASGSLTAGTQPDATPANASFPVGTYSFNTYLSTIAANCTSNPATWTCYPYFTYAQSPSNSAANFDWIIRAVPNSQNYTISSTDNVFSILFSNASLTLLSPGKDDEHYFFQLNMAKATKPAQPLGESNKAATCLFNETTLQGYLYTKREKTYPAKGGSPTGAFDPWPFAVKIEQVAGATGGSPDCTDAQGNSLGSFSVDDGTQLCDCLYLNTGT